MNKKLNRKEVKIECRKIVKKLLESEKRENYYYDKRDIELMHSMVSDKISHRGYVRENREKGE